MIQELNEDYKKISVSEGKIRGERDGGLGGIKSKQANQKVNYLPFLFASCMLALMRTAPK